MLRTKLPDIPNKMIFVHANYPAHRHSMNLECLQSFFAYSNIIGPGGMIPFPKRSFDLNLVQTMLMQEIDNQLHGLVFSNVEELKISIENVFIEMKNINFLSNVVN